MVSLPYKTENSPKKERAPFYKLGNTMRYRAHSPDYTLFIITSASPVIGEVRFGEVYFFLKNQLIGVGVGAAIFLAAWRITYTFWKKLALPMLITSLFFMALVFIPGIGLELKGAARWIDLGSITVQPAEIIKLAFIIYMAAWLEAKQKEVRRFSTGFLPFLVMLGIVSLF